MQDGPGGGTHPPVCPRAASFTSQPCRRILEPPATANRRGGGQEDGQGFAVGNGDGSSVEAECPRAAALPTPLRVLCCPPEDSRLATFCAHSWNRNLQGGQAVDRQGGGRSESGCGRCRGRGRAEEVEFLSLSLSLSLSPTLSLPLSAPSIVTFAVVRGATPHVIPRTQFLAFPRAPSRREIKRLVAANPDAAPALLRLAFHDAIARDTASKLGGANGTILWELGRRENYGLRPAMEMLEPLKNAAGLSWADSIAVAGAAAVTAAGGPKIRVRLGRVDSKEPDPQVAMDLYILQIVLLLPRSQSMLFFWRPAQFCVRGRYAPCPLIISPPESFLVAVAMHQSLQQPCGCPQA